MGQRVDRICRVLLAVGSTDSDGSKDWDNVLLCVWDGTSLRVPFGSRESVRTWIDAVEFGVEEKERLAEGRSDAEPVSLRDSVAGTSLDSDTLPLAERDIEVLTDAVKSDVKDVGGIRVGVAGPTTDCVAGWLNDAVTLIGTDSVGRSRADGVGWRLHDVEGIVERVSVFVSSAVAVGAGETVAVSCSEIVCVRVLVGSSVWVDVASSVSVALKFSERVSVADVEAVVDSVVESVAVSSAVRDPLTSRDSEAECETVTVREADAEVLWDSDAEWVSVAVNVCEAVGVGRGMTNQIVLQLPTGTIVT